MRLDGATVHTAVQAGRIDHLTISTAGPDGLTAVTTKLAREVRTRCTREEERRRIHDPFPLPVRWRPTPAHVTDHWENVRRVPGGEATDPLELNGTLDEVAQVYRRIPSGRLLVLGVPGAGKSILASRLVLQLLDSPTTDDYLVPVILSLGSWNPATTALRDWLTNQLVRDFPGLAATRPNGTTLAATLVTHDQILPVLDGFDEIANGLHRAALEALNEYHGPLVVTSRRDEYAAAVADTDVLTAAAGIDLVDLTLDDLIHYLPRTTRPGTTTTVWDPVLTALRDDPESQASIHLTTVLTTPLMAALARAIYSDTPDHHPTQLLDTHRFPTARDVEEHLLDSFVPTAYQRPAGHGHRHWHPDHVHRWLTYLAQLPDRDLAWWRLGTGIPRARQALVVAAAVATSIVLTQGLIYGTLVLTMQPDARATVLPYTLSIGFAASLTFTVLFLIATRRRGGSLEPSRIHIQFRTSTHSRTQFGARFRAGLRFGIIGGLLFLPSYELISRLGFGLLDWLLFGITQPVPPQLLLGLLNTIVWVVVVAAGAGAASGLLARFETPVDLRSAATPVDLLHTNRATCLSQIPLFGTVFGLVLVLGGGLIIQLVQHMHGPLTQLSPLTALDWAIEGPLGCGIGYVLALSAWGNWLLLARLWLPLTGQLPWPLLAFLDDAHRRGVLRQAGVVYQFRHARLQHHLATATTTG